jgi:hypothetical protein
VKFFMFQEGDDPQVESAFRQIAQLTHGAYCRFDAGAPRQLAELLRAVAAYAAGGIKALEATPGAARLLTFFDRGSPNPKGRSEFELKPVRRRGGEAAMTNLAEGRPRPPPGQAARGNTGISSTNTAVSANKSPLTRARSWWCRNMRS